MRFSVRTRLTAGFIVFFFTFTNVLPSGYSQFASLTPEKIPLARLELNLPAELGSVEESYVPPSADSVPFVIHIKTAHGDPAAQKKVKEILRFLHDSLGIRMIFAEGASEKLDPELLRFFNDEKLNLRMTDLLLERGLYTGVDLFLTPHPSLSPKGERVGVRGVEVLGVEKPRLYRAAYENFKKVLQNSGRSDAVLKATELALDQRASKIFSKETLALIKNWERFQENKIALLGYAHFLSERAKKDLNLSLADPFSQVDWPQLVRLTRLEALERDGSQGDGSGGDRPAAVISSLLKARQFQRLLHRASGPPRNDDEITLDPRRYFERFLQESLPLGFRFEDYPNFSRWMATLILRHELEGPALSRELDRLWEKLGGRLAKSARERRLLRQYERLVLFKKLLHLDLTREEWEKLKVGAPFMAPFERFESGRKGVMNHAPTIEDIAAVALRFYRLTERRESIFLEAIEREMKARHTRKAILVTGGFHAPGLAERFKEKGIGYAVISPRMGEEISSSLYHEVMLGKGHLEVTEFPESFETKARHGWDYRTEMRQVREIFNELLGRKAPDPEEKFGATPYGSAFRRFLSRVEPAPFARSERSRAEVRNGAGSVEKEPRVKKFSRRKRPTLLQGLLRFFLGSLGGILAASLIAFPGNISEFSAEHRLSLFSARLLTAIFIHHLGHVMAGKLVGLRTHLAMFRSADDSTVLLNDELLSPATFRQRIVYLLGGPLANLLLGLSPFLLSAFSSVPVTGDIASYLGFWNWALGIGSLIPIHPWAGGGLVLRLVRKELRKRSRAEVRGKGSRKKEIREILQKIKMDLKPYRMKVIDFSGLAAIHDLGIIDERLPALIGSLKKEERAVAFVGLPLDGKVPIEKWVADLTDQIVTQVERENSAYFPYRVSRVRKVLDEAVKNATVWGNRDPEKNIVRPDHLIVLRWKFQEGILTVDVIDEGKTPIDFKKHLNPPQGRFVTREGHGLYGSFLGYRDFLQEYIDKSFLKRGGVYDRPLETAEEKRIGQILTLRFPWLPHAAREGRSWNRGEGIFRSEVRSELVQYKGVFLENIPFNTEEGLSRVVRYLRFSASHVAFRDDVESPDSGRHLTEGVGGQGLVDEILEDLMSDGGLKRGVGTDLYVHQKKFPAPGLAPIFQGSVKRGVSELEDRIYQKAVAPLLQGIPNAVWPDLSEVLLSVYRTEGDEGRIEFHVHLAQEYLDRLRSALSVSDWEHVQSELGIARAEVRMSSPEPMKLEDIAKIEDAKDIDFKILQGLFSHQDEIEISRIDAPPLEAYRLDIPQHHFSMRFAFYEDPVAEGYILIFGRIDSEGNPRGSEVLWGSAERKSEIDQVHAWIKRRLEFQALNEALSRLRQANDSLERLNRTLKSLNQRMEKENARSQKRKDSHYQRALKQFYQKRFDLRLKIRNLQSEVSRMEKHLLWARGTGLQEKIEAYEVDLKEFGSQIEAAQRDLSLLEQEIQRFWDNPEDFRPPSADARAEVRRKEAEKRKRIAKETSDGDGVFVGSGQLDRRGQLWKKFRRRESTMPREIHSSSSFVSFVVQSSQDARKVIKRIIPMVALAFKLAFQINSLTRTAAAARLNTRSNPLAMWSRRLGAKRSFTTGYVNGVLGISQTLFLEYILLEIRLRLGRRAKPASPKAWRGSGPYEAPRDPDGRIRAEVRGQVPERPDRERRIVAQGFELFDPQGRKGIQQIYVASVKDIDIAEAAGKIEPLEFLRQAFATLSHLLNSFVGPRLTGIPIFLYVSHLDDRWRRLALSYRALKAIDGIIVKEPIDSQEDLLWAQKENLPLLVFSSESENPETSPLKHGEPLWLDFETKILFRAEVRNEEDRTGTAFEFHPSFNSEEIKILGQVLEKSLSEAHDVNLIQLRERLASLQKVSRLTVWRRVVVSGLVSVFIAFEAYVVSQNLGFFLQDIVIISSTLGFIVYFLRGSLGLLFETVQGARRGYFYFEDTPNPNSFEEWASSTIPRLVKEAASRAEVRKENRVAMSSLEAAKAVAPRPNNDPTSQELLFGNPLQDIFDKSRKAWRREKEGAEEHDGASWSQGKAQRIRKVQVPGNQDKRPLFHQLINFRIRGSRPEVTDIVGFMTRFFEPLAYGAWAIGVNQKLHEGLAGKGGKLLFIRQERSVEDAGTDVLVRHGSEFLFNLLGSHSHRQGLKDDEYGRPRAPDAGLPMLDVGARSDVRIKEFTLDHGLFPSRNEIYHTPSLLSSPALPDTPPDDRQLVVKSSDRSRSEVRSEKGSRGRIVTFFRESPYFYIFGPFLLDQITQLLAYLYLPRFDSLLPPEGQGILMGREPFALVVAFSERMARHGPLTRVALIGGAIALGLFAAKKIGKSKDLDVSFRRIFSGMREVFQEVNLWTKIALGLFLGSRLAWAWSILAYGGGMDMIKLSNEPVYIYNVQDLELFIGLPMLLLSPFVYFLSQKLKGLQGGSRRDGNETGSPRAEVRSGWFPERGWEAFDYAAGKGFRLSGLGSEGVDEVLIRVLEGDENSRAEGKIRLGLGLYADVKMEKYSHRLQQSEPHNPTGFLGLETEIDLEPFDPNHPRTTGETLIFHHPQKGNVQARLRVRPHNGEVRFLLHARPGVKRLPIIRPRSEVRTSPEGVMNPLQTLEQNLRAIQGLLSDINTREYRFFPGGRMKIDEFIAVEFGMRSGSVIQSIDHFRSLQRVKDDLAKHEEWLPDNYDATPSLKKMAEKVAERRQELEGRAKTIYNEWKDVDQNRRWTARNHLFAISKILSEIEASLVPQRPHQNRDQFLTEIQNWVRDPKEFPPPRLFQFRLPPTGMPVLNLLHAPRLQFLKEDVGQDLILQSDFSKHDPNLQLVRVYHGRVSPRRFRYSFVLVRKPQRRFVRSTLSFRLDSNYRFRHPLFPDQVFQISTKRGFDRKGAMNSFRVTANHRDEIEKVADQRNKPLKTLPLLDAYGGKQIGTVVMRSASLAIRSRSIRGVLPDLTLRSSKKEFRSAFVHMNGRDFWVGPREWARRKVDLRIEGPWPIEARMGKETTYLILKREDDGRINNIAREIFTEPRGHFTGSVVRFRANPQGRANLGAFLSDTPVADPSEKGVWMTAAFRNGVLIRTDEWKKVPPEDVYDFRYGPDGRLSLLLKPDLPLRPSQAHFFKGLSDFEHTPSQSYKLAVPDSMLKNHEGLIFGYAIREDGIVTLGGRDYFLPEYYQGLPVQIFRFPEERRILFVVMSRDERKAVDTFLYDLDKAHLTMSVDRMRREEAKLNRQYRYYLDLTPLWEKKIKAERRFRQTIEALEQMENGRAKSLLKNVPKINPLHYRLAQDLLRRWDRIIETYAAPDDERLAKEKLLYRDWKLSPEEADLLDSVGPNLLRVRHQLLTGLFEQTNHDPNLAFDPLLHPELLTLKLRSEPPPFEKGLRRRPLPYGYRMWTELPEELQKAPRRTADPDIRIQRAIVQSFRSFFVSGRKGVPQSPAPETALSQNVFFDREKGLGLITAFSIKRYEKNANFTLHRQFALDPEGHPRKFWLRAGWDPSQQRKVITLHLRPGGFPVGWAAWNPEEEKFEENQGPVFPEPGLDLSLRENTAWGSDPWSRTGPGRRELHVSGDRAREGRRIHLVPSYKGFWSGSVYDTRYRRLQKVAVETLPEPGSKHFVVDGPVKFSDKKHRFFHVEEGKLFSELEEMAHRFQSSWDPAVPRGIVVSLPSDGKLDLGSVGEEKPLILSLGHARRPGPRKIFVAFHLERVHGQLTKALRLYRIQSEGDGKERPVELFWSGYYGRASGRMILFPEFEPYRLLGLEKHKIQLYAWGLGYTERPGSPYTKREMAGLILKALDGKPLSMTELKERLTRQGYSAGDFAQVFGEMLKKNNSYDGRITSVGKGRYSTLHRIHFQEHNEATFRRNRLKVAVNQRLKEAETWIAFEDGNPLKLVTGDGFEKFFKRLWSFDGVLQASGTRRTEYIADEVIFSNYEIRPNGTVSLTTPKGRLRIPGRPGEVVTGLYDHGLRRVDWFPPGTELHQIYKFERSNRSLKGEEIFLGEAPAPLRTALAEGGRELDIRDLSKLIAAENKGVARAEVRGSRWESVAEGFESFHPKEPKEPQNITLVFPKDFVGNQARLAEMMEEDLPLFLYVLNLNNQAKKLARAHRRAIQGIIINESKPGDLEWAQRVKMPVVLLGTAARSNEEEIRRIRSGDRMSLNWEDHTLHRLVEEEGSEGASSRAEVRGVAEEVREIEALAPRVLERHELEREKKETAFESFILSSEVGQLYKKLQNLTEALLESHGIPGEIPEWAQDLDRLDRLAEDIDTIVDQEMKTRYDFLEERILDFIKLVRPSLEIPEPYPRQGPPTVKAEAEPAPPPADSDWLRQELKMEEKAVLDLLNSSEIDWNMEKFYWKIRDEFGDRVPYLGRIDGGVAAFAIAMGVGRQYLDRIEAAYRRSVGIVKETSRILKTADRTLKVSYQTLKERLDHQPNAELADIKVPPGTLLEVVGEETRQQIIQRIQQLQEPDEKGRTWNIAGLKSQLAEWIPVVGPSNFSLARTIWGINIQEEFLKEYESRADRLGGVLTKVGETFGWDDKRAASSLEELLQDLKHLKNAYEGVPETQAKEPPALRTLQALEMDSNQVVKELDLPEVDWDFITLIDRHPRVLGWLKSRGFEFLVKNLKIQEAASKKIRERYIAYNRVLNLVAQSFGMKNIEGLKRLAEAVGVDLAGIEIPRGNLLTPLGVKKEEILTELEKSDWKTLAQLRTRMVKQMAERTPKPRVIFIGRALSNADVILGFDLAADFLKVAESRFQERQNLDRVGISFGWARGNAKREMGKILTQLIEAQIELPPGLSSVLPEPVLVSVPPEPPVSPELPRAPPLPLSQEPVTEPQIEVPLSDGYLLMRLDLNREAVRKELDSPEVDWKLGEYHEQLRQRYGEKVPALNFLGGLVGFAGALGLRDEYKEKVIERYNDFVGIGSKAAESLDVHPHTLSQAVFPALQIDESQIQIPPGTLLKRLAEEGESDEDVRKRILTRLNQPDEEGKTWNLPQLKKEIAQRLPFVRPNNFSYARLLWGLNLANEKDGFLAQYFECLKKWGGVATEVGESFGWDRYSAKQTLERTLEELARLMGKKAIEIPTAGTLDALGMSAEQVIAELEDPAIDGNLSKFVSRHEKELSWLVTRGYGELIKALGIEVEAWARQKMRERVRAYSGVLKSAAASLGVTLDAFQKLAESLELDLSTLKIPAGNLLVTLDPNKAPEVKKREILNRLNQSGWKDFSKLKTELLNPRPLLPEKWISQSQLIWGLDLVHDFSEIEDALMKKFKGNLHTAGISLGWAKGSAARTLEAIHKELKEGPVRNKSVVFTPWPEELTKLDQRLFESVPKIVNYRERIQELLKLGEAYQALRREKVELTESTVLPEAALIHRPPGYDWQGSQEILKEAVLAIQVRQPEMEYFWIEKAPAYAVSGKVHPALYIAGVDFKKGRVSPVHRWLESQRGRFVRDEFDEPHQVPWTHPLFDLIFQQGFRPAGSEPYFPSLIARRLEVIDRWIALEREPDQLEAIRGFLKTPFLRQLEEARLTGGTEGPSLLEIPFLIRSENLDRLFAWAKKISEEGSKVETQEALDFLKLLTGSKEMNAFWGRQRSRFRPLEILIYKLEHGPPSEEILQWVKRVAEKMDAVREGPYAVSRRLPRVGIEISRKLVRKPKPEAAPVAKTPAAETPVMEAPVAEAPVTEAPVEEKPEKVEAGPKEKLQLARGYHEQSRRLFHTQPKEARELTEKALELIGEATDALDVNALSARERSDYFLLLADLFLDADFSQADVIYNLEGALRAEPEASRRLEIEKRILNLDPQNEGVARLKQERVAEEVRLLEAKLDHTEKFSEQFEIEEEILRLDPQNAKIKGRRVERVRRAIEGFKEGIRPSPQGLIESLSRFQDPALQRELEAELNRKEEPAPPVPISLVKEAREARGLLQRVQAAKAQSKKELQSIFEMMERLLKAISDQSLGEIGSQRDALIAALASFPAKRSLESHRELIRPTLHLAWQAVQKIQSSPRAEVRERRKAILGSVGDGEVGVDVRKVSSRNPAARIEDFNPIDAAIPGNVNQDPFLNFKGLPDTARLKLDVKGIGLPVKFDFHNLGRSLLPIGSNQDYRSRLSFEDHRKKSTTKPLDRQLLSPIPSAGPVGIPHSLLNLMPGNPPLTDSLLDMMSVIKKHIPYDIESNQRVKAFRPRAEPASSEGTSQGLASTKRRGTPRSRAEVRSAADGDKERDRNVEVKKWLEILKTEDLSSHDYSLAGSALTEVVLQGEEPHASKAFEGLIQLLNSENLRSGRYAFVAEALSQIAGKKPGLFTPETIPLLLRTLSRTEVFVLTYQRGIKTLMTLLQKGSKEDLEAWIEIIEEILKIHPRDLVTQQQFLNFEIYGTGAETLREIVESPQEPSAGAAFKSLVRILKTKHLKDWAYGRTAYELRELAERGKAPYAAKAFDALQDILQSAALDSTAYQQTAYSLKQLIQSGREPLATQSFEALMRIFKTPGLSPRARRAVGHQFWALAEEGPERLNSEIVKEFETLFASEDVHSEIYQQALSALDRIGTQRPDLIPERRSRHLYRLMSRIVSHRFPDTDFDQIRRAYDLAHQIHEGHPRPDKMDHVVRAAEIALELGSRSGQPVEAANLVSAALLHDVIEDAAEGAPEVRRRIRDTTNRKVERIVWELTRREAPSKDWEVKKAQDEAYDRQLLRSSYSAQLIKLADREDNYGKFLRRWYEEDKKKAENERRIPHEIARSLNLIKTSQKLKFSNHRFLRFLDQEISRLEKETADPLFWQGIRAQLEEAVIFEKGLLAGTRIPILRIEHLFNQLLLRNLNYAFESGREAIQRHDEMVKKIQERLEALRTGEASLHLQGELLSEWQEKLGANNRLHHSLLRRLRKLDKRARALVKVNRETVSEEELGKRILEFDSLFRQREGISQRLLETAVRAEELLFELSSFLDEGGDDSSPPRAEVRVAEPEGHPKFFYARATILVPREIKSIAAYEAGIDQPPSDRWDEKKLMNTVKEWGGSRGDFAPPGTGERASSMRFVVMEDGVIGKADTKIAGFMAVRLYYTKEGDHALIDNIIVEKVSLNPAYQDRAREVIHSMLNKLENQIKERKWKTTPLADRRIPLSYVMRESYLQAKDGIHAARTRALLEWFGEVRPKLIEDHFSDPNEDGYLYTKFFEPAGKGETTPSRAEVREKGKGEKEISGENGALAGAQANLGRQTSQSRPLGQSWSDKPTTGFVESRVRPPFGLDTVYDPNQEIKPGGNNTPQEEKPQSLGVKNEGDQIRSENRQKDLRGIVPASRIKSHRGKGIPNTTNSQQIFSYSLTPLRAETRKVAPEARKERQAEGGMTEIGDSPQRGGQVTPEVQRILQDPAIRREIESLSGETIRPETAFLVAKETGWIFDPAYPPQTFLVMLRALRVFRREIRQERIPVYLRRIAEALRLKGIPLARRSEEAGAPFFLYDHVPTRTERAALVFSLAMNPGAKSEVVIFSNRELTPQDLARIEQSQKQIAKIQDIDGNPLQTSFFHSADAREIVRHLEKAASRLGSRKGRTPAAPRQIVATLSKALLDRLEEKRPLIPVLDPDHGRISQVIYDEPRTNYERLALFGAAAKLSKTEYERLPEDLYRRLLRRVAPSRFLVNEERYREIPPAWRDASLLVESQILQALAQAA